MAAPRRHLNTAFAELGRIKLNETNLDGILARVAGLAKEAVPGTVEASVTLMAGARVRTAAATGPLALRLDEWQYEQRMGPCLEAAAGHGTRAVPDLAAEQRWPDWAARAAAAGAGSSLSIQLPIGERLTGALNLYGARPHAFDDESTETAQQLVDHAVSALRNAHLYDTSANLAQHMRVAMVSRAVIEQAKGIVMGERRCTAKEAFAILTKESQDSNRKLRDVAAALVDRTQDRARPT